MSHTLSTSLNNIDKLLKHLEKRLPPKSILSFRRSGSNRS